MPNKRNDNTQQKKYLLLIPGTNDAVFQGEYTKYYMGCPYIAVFENYPAASTRIWICKATTGNPATDKRIRILAMRKPFGETKQIGNYTKIGEVQTEADANEKIERLINGDNIFRLVLGGAGK